MRSRRRAPSNSHQAGATSGHERGVPAGIRDPTDEAPLPSQRCRSPPLWRVVALAAPSGSPRASTSTTRASRCSAPIESFAKRVKELEELMARAAQGSGGHFIGQAVYRTEYQQVLGERQVIASRDGGKALPDRRRLGERPFGVLRRAAQVVLAQSPPRQRRALAERIELGDGDVAAHRRHAAIGAQRRCAPWRRA